MASSRPTAYIVVLLIGMAVLFNIERLDFGSDNLINISSYVYVIASLAAVAIIAIPWLMRLSPAVLVGSCLGIYLIAKLFIFDNHPLVGGIYTWISGVEIVMLSALVFIAHHLAHALRDFETAYGKTRLADVRRTTDPLMSAAQMVRSAFALCRRHHQPLSVVVVASEASTSLSGPDTRLTDLVLRLLRSTDILMEQPSDGHLVIVCQQTDADGSELLSRRFHAQACQHLGISVQCATASFPDDGVTFEALVHRAEDRLQNATQDSADEEPPGDNRGREIDATGEVAKTTDTPEAQQGDRSCVYNRAPWLRRISPDRRWLRGHKYLIAKSILDLVLVIVTMPLWLFVLGVCALLIKIDSPRGSVFFCQQRTGKGGGRFTLYKLRTMVRDAETLKQQHAAKNIRQWPDYKIDSDPRVTRIGRFLRKSSLDELPQLFNVLKGDMSLVGPRPTSFAPQTYQRWQTERLEVMPGITGLWQLIGRGDPEWEGRVRFDIAYIERRCLWLDIQILVRTIPAVVCVRGVY
jgi:lipopolysaccharide/colanic/teichoic acid biosynthesis glycosyltransferase